MRKTFSDRVERGRLTESMLGVHLDHFASSRGDDFGFFELRTNDGVVLRIQISSGSDEITWEHVSVSTRSRCPTWEEMAWVKSLFWEDEETVMQLHPPKSQYVNHHPYCLHLWRPLHAEIVLPPTVAVGPMRGEVG